MKIWAVNQVYDPYVSHGYEPVALFSTPELAQAFRDRCEAEQTQRLIDKAEYYKRSTKPDSVFTVEEWDVDDEWTKPG